MKKILLLAVLTLGLLAGGSMQAYHGWGCESCGYSYSYPSYSYYGDSYYGDACCRGSLHWGSYYL